MMGYNSSFNWFLNFVVSSIKPFYNESEWIAGNEEKLIEIVLNGMQGDIMVKEKTYNGLMPDHGHLDDHAIASIVTYIRKRFGNESSPVSALNVKEIRNRTIDNK